MIGRQNPGSEFSFHLNQSFSLDLDITPGLNASDIRQCLAAQELNIIVSELLIGFTAQPQNLQDHKHDIHLRALLLGRTYKHKPTSWLPWETSFSSHKLTQRLKRIKVAWCTHTYTQKTNKKNLLICFCQRMNDKTG